MNNLSADLLLIKLWSIIWVIEATENEVLEYATFRPGFSELTDCGLVMPYGGRDLGQHWFR